MAKEYALKGVSFVFVYTREAHPGEHCPAIRSMDQKLAHARAFRDELGVDRPILVDELDGAGHRLYGSLPNMTYLISRAGKVLFKAAWTDAPTIRFALEYVLASRDRRRDGLRLAPFYVELVGYRTKDPDKFLEGLARNGSRAVADWAAFTKCSPRGPRPGRIELGE